MRLVSLQSNKQQVIKYEKMNNVQTPKMIMDEKRKDKTNRDKVKD